MSFLSCLSHPTLVVASVGGVSLGVTLLLLPWKTAPSMTSGNSFPTSNQLVIKKLEGNCKVIEDPISEKLPTFDSPYVSVYCENGLIVGADSMLNKWIGFFPKSLFKKGADEFKEDEKLTIDVKEIIPPEGNHEEAYETFFISEKFSKNILKGIWGIKLVEDIEKDNKGIYLVRLLNESGISEESFYIWSKYI